MNDRKMVSVVVITYAQEKFIREAIEGVLMQKVNFEVELIIADDNSPDNTEFVVNSFSNHPHFKWIKYTKHSENKGMMPNFIWALDQAKGKYIALCEGDDYWTDPLKLQKQVNFLEANEDCSMCFHRTDELLLDGTIQKSMITYAEQANCFFEIVDLAKGNFIHTPSVVYKNNLFKIPKWMSLVSVGDYPMWMMLAFKGKVGYIGEPMSHYRVGVGVWSKGKSIVNIQHWIKMLYFLEFQFNNTEIKPLIHNQLFNMQNQFEHNVFIYKLNSYSLAKNARIIDLIKAIGLKSIIKLGLK